MSDLPPSSLPDQSAASGGGAATTSPEVEAAAAAATAAPTQQQIFAAIARYPFASDVGYQAGLSAILGHPESPATAEEVVQKAGLVRQAECFYFSRKFNVPPIDAAAYASWLSTQSPTQAHAAHPAGGATATHIEAQPHISPAQPEPSISPPLAPPDSSAQQQSASASQPSPSPAQPISSSSASSPPQDQPPPYPTPFAAIVDLITRNIPVPGIEEIPDTVLEPGSSKVDKTPRRRKPWEKDDDESNAAEAVEGLLDVASTTATATTTSTSSAVQTTDSSSASDQLDGGEAKEDKAHEPHSIDVNGHRETGTGVVNILKPNAVPDSGLLSKD